MTDASRMESQATSKRVMFVRLPPFMGFKSHHPRDVTLPLTIAYAATMAQKAGWDTTVLDIWSSDETMQGVLERIRSTAPDVICFESDASPFPVIKECVCKLRNFSDATVMAFGSMPTFLPERVVGPDGPFDIGIVGEAEMTIAELLETIENDGELSDVAGIVFWDGMQLCQTPSRFLLQDLDELPPVDYDLFRLDDYYKYSFPMPLHSRVRWGHVLSSRGCPYPCSHCSFDHRQSYGPKHRRHSPRRVVDEMETLQKRGINAISIEDDHFTFHRQHVYDICDEIQRRGLKLKWVVQTRVDCYDLEMLRRMKAAGCVGLSLGIESGNDRVLRALNKGFTRQQALDGIRLAQNEGFMLRLLFMVGNPTERPEEIRDTISLVRQAKAITIQVHISTPYPGTRLLDQAEHDGRYIEDFSSYNKIVQNLSATPDEELWALQKEFYHRYFFSWRYLKVFVSQRLRYLAGSWRRELPLFWRAAWYLLWSSRRQSQRNVDQVFKGVESPPQRRHVETERPPVLVPLALPKLQQKTAANYTGARRADAA